MVDESLAQPGFGPLERVIIDSARLNLDARVDRERVVWTHGTDLGDILLARKVDIPSFPTQ